MPTNYFDPQLMKRRSLLRSEFREEDIFDQALNIAQPPLYKVGDYTAVYSLCKEKTTSDKGFYSILADRKSTRSFDASAGLSLLELSTLLHYTQGIKQIRGNAFASFRHVPSSGARHPFETYVVIRACEHLPKGIYHYNAMTHQIGHLCEVEDYEALMARLIPMQKFAKKSDVLLIWTIVPFRGEWRYYGDLTYKSMMIDAGHVCQNLYLVADELGLGTCAIANYDQIEVDRVLDLDTQDEFAFYMACVGRKK